MNTDAANSLPQTDAGLRHLTDEEINLVAGAGWAPFLGQPYIYTKANTQTSGNGLAEALGLVAGGAAVAYSSASSSGSGSAFGSAIAAFFI